MAILKKAIEAVKNIVSKVNTSKLVSNVVGSGVIGGTPGITSSTLAKTITSPATTSAPYGVNTAGQYSYATPQKSITTSAPYGVSTVGQYSYATPQVASAGSNLKTSSTGSRTVSSGSGITLASSPTVGGMTLLNSPTTQSINNLGTNVSNVPMSNVVNTNTLTANNQKLLFPEATTPDYSSVTPTAVEEQLAETKDRDTVLEDYLKELTQMPSSEDAYAKAQRETQILQKQQRVNDLTGQLNAIVNKGQAQQLSIVGQGRGIPEAIIGGQQAQIGRETAIAALPIQAQLSAAQGDLEMANSHLETLFKIYSDDAEREYTARVAQKKMVYEYASEKEKRALEKLDLQEQRAYNETRELVKTQEDYAKMALANNQGAVYRKITSLSPSSPTYRQDLANAVSQIYDSAQDLDLKIKQAQLNKLNMVEISETTPNQSQILSLQDKLTTIDGLINHKGLSNAVGTVAAGRKAPFQIGQKQDFIAGVQQLVSRDTLDTLINLKKAGGTLGALSDQERIMLQSAASKIGTWKREDKKGNVIGYKASESAFKKELQTIKTLTERALVEAGGDITNNYIDTIEQLLEVNPYLQAGYILE